VTNQAFFVFAGQLKNIYVVLLVSYLLTIRQISQTQIPWISFNPMTAKGNYLTPSRSKLTAIHSKPMLLLDQNPTCGNHNLIGFAIMYNKNAGELIQLSSACMSSILFANASAKPTLFFPH